MRQVIASLEGQKITVVVESGALGAGLVDTQVALDAALRAEDAADEAEAALASVPGIAAAAGSAAGSTAGSAAGTTSGATAGTAAANAVVAGKANISGDNITAPSTFRTAIGAQGFVSTLAPSYATAFPFGSTTALGARTWTAAFAPDAGVPARPLFGEILQYTTNVGAGLIPYQVGQFISLVVQAGGGNGYTRNAVYEVQAGASASGTADELNVNNFAVHYDDPNIFGSNPWLTVQNMVITGDHRITAARVVTCPPGAGQIINYGDVFWGNFFVKAEILAATQAPTVIEVRGVRTGPIFDTTQATAQTFAALGPSQRILFGNQASRGGGGVLTFAANTANPNVGADADILWKTDNASATTVTALAGGMVGMKTAILVNDANTTIQHNASMILKGAVNATPANGSIFTFVRDGTIWREMSRSY